LALDVFTSDIRHSLGAMLVELGGADAITFTGGIGENASALRAQILEPLAFLGAELDPARNASDAREKVITTEGSRIAVWVVPTNEELMIAQKTQAIVESEMSAGLLIAPEIGSAIPLSTS